MTNGISKLELLPNEVFIEIFQYFDAKELFEAFENLNNRFNRILRSFGYLSFKFYDSGDIQRYDFIPYVDNLVIYCQTYFNPQVFNNIRHLRIIYLTEYSLTLFDNQLLPYLEDLTIKKVLGDSYTFLYNKIFSGTFPNLKSCYVCQVGALIRSTDFSYLPMLCCLKIGIIDLQIYGLILSICPNLNYFKFRIKSSERSFNIEPHIKLKCLIIKTEDYIQSKNDSLINICLSFVPNLERLYINQDFFQGNISYYLKSDWYASIINQYLPLLNRFICNYRASHLTVLDIQVMNIVHEMKMNFFNAQNDRYQSLFNFKLI